MASSRDPEQYVGRRVVKYFDGESFGGVVHSVRKPTKGQRGANWWLVKYDDGDSEDVGIRELSVILAEDNKKGAKAAPPAKANGKRAAPVPAPKKAKQPRRSSQPPEPPAAAAPAAVLGPTPASVPAGGCPPLGEETPEERQLRADLGIKLGAVRKVHKPQPLEVMLRHHADCRCSVQEWDCTWEGNPVKAAEAAVKRAQRELDTCRCRLCREVAVGPVTTPCGHSFCKECLIVKASAQKAPQQASQRSSSRRAAATASQVSCPKCSQGIGSWFSGGSPPADLGLAKAAVAANQSLVTAQQAVTAAAAAAAAQPEVVLDPPESVAELVEGAEDGEEAVEEEKDRPADAILVGERLRGPDGQPMGKNWRSKCWYEYRQVGTVHLEPPFTDPKQVVLPEWSKDFPEDDRAEMEAKQEVEKALKIYEKTFKEATELLQADHAKNGAVNEDGRRKSKRPDLKAQTLMRSRIQFIGQTVTDQTPATRAGTLPGMPVGSSFTSRAELMVVGMHSHWLNGICCGKAQLKSGSAIKSIPFVTAISMAGGYEDDQDGGDVCHYTGEGGNDLLHDGRQIGDQSWTRGNLALAHNCDLGVPVRVIRKNTENSSYTKNAFIYDGLYHVRRYWKEIGKSGYYTCKFQLERLPDQRVLETHSVHFRNQSGSSLPQGQRAEDRPGFVMRDISLGQEALPVCVVNEIDPKSDAWAPDPLPLLACSDPEKDPVKGAAWPSDPEERSRAFVYTTRQIRSALVPTPVPAVHLSAKQLAVLNGGSCPYNSAGMALEAKFCFYEQAPAPDAAPGPTCSAQLGVRYRLEVFRTQGKGWGVRSWDRIPVGAFVCEFTGEVLTRAEMESRVDDGKHVLGGGEKEKDESGQRVRQLVEGDANEYMFDLTVHGVPLYQHATGRPLPGEAGGWVQDPSRKGDGDKDMECAKAAISNANLTEDDAAVVYNLDGKHAGSVARFINHNHTHPNLVVQMCLWDHHDPRMMRLCLFAAETIPPLTELTYDYGSEYEVNNFDSSSLRSLKVGSR